MLRDRGREILPKILLGANFFWGWRESEDCVYEEYKVKIKMVQEHEIKFLLDYNIKIVI